MPEKTIKGNPLGRGERLQIMLDDDELKAVEDFRFARRMPSRAAAVRELLKRGLASEGFKTAKAGSQSREFGVLETGAQNGGRSSGLPNR
jgi:hypothetical protein